MHNLKINLFILLNFPVKEYGLFCTDDDPRKGSWLEPGRTLEYYMLKDHVSIIFIRISLSVAL